MFTRKNILLIFLIGFILLGYRNAAFSNPIDIQVAQVTMSKPNPIFKEIVPALKVRTQVPILLPTYILYTSTPSTAVSIIETASASQYRLMLAFDKDCNGGNWCRLGLVSGEKITPKTLSLVGTPISLGINLTGYFVDSVCGANCTDSTLKWNKNGFRYTVGIKAGKSVDLVNMAKSTSQY